MAVFKISQTNLGDFYLKPNAEKLLLKGGTRHLRKAVRNYIIEVS